MILDARWFDPTIFRSPKFSCESAATASVDPLRTATAIDTSRMSSARRALLAGIVGGVHEIDLEGTHAVHLDDRRRLALREVTHVAGQEGIGPLREELQLLRVEDVAHADG